VSRRRREECGHVAAQDLLDAGDARILDFFAGPDVATEEGGDGLGEVRADRELAEAGSNLPGEELVDLDESDQVQGAEPAGSGSFAARGESIAASPEEKRSVDRRGGPRSAARLTSSVLPMRRRPVAMRSSSSGLTESAERAGTRATPTALASSG
jgi:hypothetical protein